MGSSYAAMEHFSDAIKCFEQALNRDLDEEEKRLVQTQMNRCSLLLKSKSRLQNSILRFTYSHNNGFTCWSIAYICSRIKRN